MYLPFFEPKDAIEYLMIAARAADSANWLSCQKKQRAKVMPDDHSEVVPLLPIPNRTVKRLSADDSADSRVKVGHCQAINPKGPRRMTGAFFF